MAQFITENIPYVVLGGLILYLIMVIVLNKFTR